MSTFSAIVDDVIALTGRPDLLAETRLAVRASTLKAHHSDFFPRDLIEQTILFDTPAALQTLNFRDFFPRWRKLRYVREVIDGEVGAFLEVVSPESSQDYFNLPRNDVAYQAGMAIQIRNNTALDMYIFGFYQHPVAVETGYDSWIAEEYPYVLIYEATATVFQTVGLQERVAFFQQKVAELYKELKTNCLSEVGF